VGLFFVDEVGEGEEVVDDAHEDSFVEYFDDDEFLLVVGEEVAVAEDVNGVEEDQHSYLNGTIVYEDYYDDDDQKSAKHEKWIIENGPEFTVESNIGI
jgi:hypothetical protein